MDLFFNDAATPEIYTLSLHDALPISPCVLWLWPKTGIHLDDPNVGVGRVGRDFKSPTANSTSASLAKTGLTLRTGDGKAGRALHLAAEQFCTLPQPPVCQRLAC